MRSATTFLLAFVGAALLHAPLRAEDAPATPVPKSIDLRVATFNVWLIPLFSEDRRRRMERLPAALRALELDVLCLQEAWLSTDQEKIAAALRTTFPHAVRAQGGLMLLSRFPVLASRFIPFPRYKGLSVPEMLANKGLLDAVLQTPGGNLRVVTAHLALTFGPDNPRSKQLQFLIRHVKDKRDLPLVMPADLNTWPVDKGLLTDDYRDLLRPGLIDANPPVRRHDQKWDPGRPTRFEWPRTAGEKDGWYPDHILLRSGRGGTLAVRAFAMALDTPKTALSDHNLLHADVTLTPARAKRKAAAAPGDEQR